MIKMTDTKSSVTWGIVFVLFACYQHVESTFLKINNNRYDDLVVAISPDIKEDTTIITKIQNIIKDASPFLYGATRRRAYFGNVKILLPETWTPNPSWTTATVETFEDADIRIDKPHPVYGNNPYTFQPEQCGDPGKYIHLTSEYVLDKDENGIYTWGPAGRLLVHEFSHLRYGVFDEYGLGTKQHPYFYLDGEVVYPTGCVAAIRGSLSGNCTTDPVTKLPSKDCNFVGDTQQNTAKASIMYDFAINTVTTFCESDVGDPDLQHNHLAPNQQNKMCNNRGTWDVIKEHADFKGANLPVTKAETELKPTFTILYDGKTTSQSGDKVQKICGRPVVLVLDVSGSMVGDRQFRQTQTADKLIRDILPVGTKVGIVSFSSSAHILQPLTMLSTEADRNNVSDHLPSYYSGSTGIGSGLRLAIQMLRNAGELKDGRIILITDGEENRLPTVAEMQKEIISSGIRVHAVAYSMKAAAAIHNLTTVTGGQYAYYSEDPRSTALDSIIQTLMTDISICSKQVRIEIMRTAKALVPNGKADGTITIDPTMGNDTMFVFTIPQHVTVTVTLNSPDGNVYSAGSLEYKFDANLNIARFNFQHAQSGVWHYTLKSSSTGTVSLVVKALPAGHGDPYEVTSWLSSSATDLNRPKQDTVVYVHVHKGYSPVLEADVTVTVERPSPASPVTLKPLDNGILPDNMADDGVYSTYFTEYSGNQRYSLDVDVRNIIHKTVYITNGTSTYGGAMSRYHNTTVAPKKVSADNFTRSTSPGALDVKGFTPGKDNYSPSRVTDLQSIVTDSENRTVTLSWTAPGDDYNIGTASLYEIRMAQSVDQLLNHFNESQRVDDSMIISGSLKPSIANTKETITVETPSNWTTIVFALRTWDETMYVSDISNSVSATFNQVKLHGQTSLPTTERSQEPDTSTSANSQMTVQTQERSTQTKSSSTVTKRATTQHHPTEESPRPETLPTITFKHATLYEQTTVQALTVSQRPETSSTATFKHVTINKYTLDQSSNERQWSTSVTGLKQVTTERIPRHEHSTTEAIKQVNTSHGQTGTQTKEAKSRPDATDSPDTTLIIATVGGIIGGLILIAIVVFVASRGRRDKIIVVLTPEQSVEKSPGQFTNSCYVQMS